MKTSNILLSLFFGAITCYILAAFAEIRISGQRNSLGLEFDERQIPVDHFTTVVARNISFRLTFSESAAISVRYATGREASLPAFHISGDSLFLDQFSPSEDSHASLHLTLSRKAFRRLDCRGCQITIESGGTDSLSVALVGGALTKWSSDTSSFDRMQVMASGKAQVNLMAIRVRNLAVNLDDCQVNISGPVGTLTGSMENHSRLAVDEVLEFSFRRDPSSMLHHRK